jgi:hypothetical protein
MRQTYELIRIPNFFPGEFYKRPHLERRFQQHFLMQALYQDPVIISKGRDLFQSN